MMGGCAPDAGRNAVPGTGPGRLRVSLLGAGSIGAPLRDLLMAGSVTGCELGAVVTSSVPADDVVDRLTSDADVVVEVAGVEAVRSFAAAIVRGGTDLVLCSVGALADDGLAAALTVAEAGGGRCLVPPGALGGLDTLRAALRAGSQARVQLTTTKRPVALGVVAAAPTVVFDGTAREAARRFPRTANIAVTLAHATCGLDGVRVVVVADPAADRTRHEVAADTAVGRYRFQFLNDTMPDSGGRTSAITMWSVVTVLETLSHARGVSRGSLV
jgi:aspartate dehydrogenase